MIAHAEAEAADLPGRLQFFQGLEGTARRQDLIHVPIVHRVVNEDDVDATEQPVRRLITPAHVVSAVGVPAIGMCPHLRRYGELVAHVGGQRRKGRAEVALRRAVGRGRVEVAYA